MFLGLSYSSWLWSSRAARVGIGAVIEKSFEGGRGALEDLGVQVESLAVIDRFEGDRIVFAE
jgi:xanthine phosphoribosyltransferase